MKLETEQKEFSHLTTGVMLLWKEQRETQINTDNSFILFLLFILFSWYFSSLFIYFLIYVPIYLLFLFIHLHIYLVLFCFFFILGVLRISRVS